MERHSDEVELTETEVSGGKQPAYCSLYAGHITGFSDYHFIAGVDERRHFLFG